MKPSKAEASRALSILKLGRDIGNRQVALVQAFIDNCPDEPAPSPATGADVQWTEAHNAATYLQHHIGEGDEGACNALDTIDKFILLHVAPSPTKPEGAFDTSGYVIVGHDGVPRRNHTKPEGLEWKDSELWFNGEKVGHIEFGSLKASDAIYAPRFLGRLLSSSYNQTIEQAKAALETAAISWLSPVSNASDTVAVSRVEAMSSLSLNIQNERLARWQGLADLAEHYKGRADRLRASLNGEVL